MRKLLILAGISTAAAVHAAPRQGAVLDIHLAELFGIRSMARIGTFPAGTAGLSAATTACNNGSVGVPWNQTMAETHPFIGLALFREKDGALEMIGKNWIKHGWAAAIEDRCGLGCTGGDGDTLEVGCSDTYCALANAAQYFLGPREEVNPYTGEWQAFGSFFDGVPVDGQRDYMGGEPNAVVHTLEVADGDLANQNGDGSDARYFYEGAYYVAGDDSLQNNIGWRECTMTWVGFWSFTTLGPGLAPNAGPVVTSWGDQQDVAPVSAGDGDVALAVDVTDLGGTWHYEYALYNRNSNRGLRSFAVPVGGATVTNAEFRDIDSIAANDWSIDVQSGMVTWSTDDHATNPAANALTYQSLFNFRFDADQPPVASAGIGGIFGPGPGNVVFLYTQAPATATPSPVAALDAGLTLSGARPNPFAGATRVAFSLPRAGPARLRVVDVTGRTVRTLLDGGAPAGRSTLAWDGRDETGARVGAGVYFFRLEVGRDARTRRGVLVR